MKVAFFGGSFNPPHVGHVLAASYARSVGFEKVLVVVVHQHAFAKPLEAFEHRVEMARLAFEPLIGVEVSPIEATLPAPSYTLHTLQALLAEHPDWQLRLLMGSDVVGEAAQWHAFEQVERLAPPFVLGRSGAPHPDAAGVLLPDVSSTEVRTYLQNANDQAPARWLQRHVPSAVLEYIRERRLYA